MDRKFHVITHDSYVTTVESYEPKTNYPVPAIKSSSIAIMKDLVCITPSIEDSPSFICLNLKNSSDHWHGCGNGYDEIVKGLLIQQNPGFIP